MIVIQRKKINDLKRWFSEYAQSFINGDEECERNIVLKADHTGRVCQEILQLGQAMRLNTQELRLAEIIALFHDIGRFEQYVRYRTFADRLSEDHASLGIRILKENEVLNKFDKSTVSLILRTIRYHNRAALPHDETERCLFFSKLLRDADKLDIWKVVTDYYHCQDKRRNVAIELDLPDTPGISEFVYQDIIHQRIVHASHIRNLNDFKVLQMGWIFDVNFKSTFHAIRSRQYLEMIRQALPESDEIQDIFNRVRLYLDQHLNSSRNESQLQI
ncbi:HD domain-containing protein [bacterium]|nr:HD domain-containing protein [bacterium]RQV97969.1 MAG: HD domain-containing protein [bacterium]